MIRHRGPGIVLALAYGMGAATSEAWAGSVETIGSRLRLRTVAAPEVGDDTRASWLRWLDDGLREGRHGRLLAEYGSVLHDRRVGHVVVESVDGPESHALYRVCDVGAGGARWRIGMIGLVYTAPGSRGRGLARRCIAGAEAAIARAGGVATLLWSDRIDFYGRQGFRPIGREVFCGVDSRVHRGLAACREPDWEVGGPRLDEWSTLEGLYARATSRIARSPGSLRSLAGAPDCVLRVARREGGARAYAALGRGDDFRGVVHEWAGDEAGVLACLEDLFVSHGPLAVMTGPRGGGLLASLRQAGAAMSQDAFALAHALDPVGLWRGLGAITRGIEIQEDHGLALVGETGRFPIAVGDFLALVLGPDSETSSARAWLKREGADELLAALPAPLYVWGFDSV